MARRELRVFLAVSADEVAERVTVSTALDVGLFVALLGGLILLVGSAAAARAV